MLNPVLTEAQNNLLKDERRVLQDVLTTLLEWEMPEQDKKVLQQALVQLDELFLLVIVGEFNAGKSSFINALLGERFLAEGVTPTTAQIHILKYGEREREPQVEGQGILLRTYPAEFLRNVALVDTPGTNAVLREHEQISRDFVPRADLILFVTSADRPFSESERAFLELIRNWGKKVVIVINKADLLETETERSTVVDFVKNNASRLLGVTPEVFPVSSKQAMRAKANDEAPPTDFDAMESYLIHSLNDSGRVRLKLDSPLGVGQKVLDDARQRAVARNALLTDDLSTLNQVEKQLTLYRTNLTEEFQNYLLRIDAILNQMQRRGEDFFDSTFRVSRIFDLMNTNAIKGEFEQAVIGDAPQQIEKQVQDMIDWMVEREARQWRTLAKQLGSRHKTEYLAGAAEDAVGGFEYNRRTLLQTIGRSTADVVANYDAAAEAHELSQNVQNALTQFGLVEAGALGLAGLLWLTLPAALDPTGLLAAGVIGAAGFAILPMRKSEAKRKLRQKLDLLRERLHTALDETFDTEVERTSKRLNEAVAPYADFVRTEHDRLQTVQTTMSTLYEQIQLLRKRITEL